MRPIAIFLLVCGLCGFAAPRAEALESPVFKTSHAEVTLVSETKGIQPGQSFRLGLHFKLAKGWHIYWVNPGDAGEPPRLDLTLPAGAKASEIAWPAPLRIPEGPVMTYGYRGEVLLPFSVTLASDAASLPIDVKAGWLVCEKICVPEEGSFHLDMPVGTVSSSAEAPLFAAADHRTPNPAPFVARLAAEGTLSVEGADISPTSVADAWFFPDKWGAIDDAASQKPTISPGKLTLALKPGQSFDANTALTGVLAIKDPNNQEKFYTLNAESDKSVPMTAWPPSGERAASPPVPARANQPAANDLAPLSLLLFAFLGGLILNLMPCVFPILAMKAVGIAKLSGHERGAVRAHAASYTLGVLLAFAALGALLLALRAAGTAAGWGFQFQSPAFVGGMVWLLVAIGLNLSGAFEVGSIAGIGGMLSPRAGHVGSFFTGFLAVLVATPCTAPFMAAAVAAALTLPSAATIVVFMVMGLGLAAPYALLAIAPGLARALPRPGKWMEMLKQLLAFPMYAAAAWLLWVMSQQSGPDGVLAAAAGTVLVGFAAWAWGATQTQFGAWRVAGRIAALAATIAASLVLYEIATAPMVPATPARTEQEPYSAARLAALRAEGRPVFVNMTAAWCITCLVNERVALASEAVRKAFAERHVAYLKGDWTRTDPAVTQFLREHDRDGVPLYVLYPPKSADPIVLPQILTANTVLSELDRLGG
jgi:thiol:disulfide interchange protein